MRFREPSAWQTYRTQILVIAAVLLLQAGLIAWLIHEHRRRHIAELATREAMFELTQMNRIAGAGELSASIAHEVNQPLAAIALNASAALNWLKAKTPDLEEARDALVRVVSDSHRAGNIIASLRSLFRKDVQQKGSVEINKVVLSVLELVRIELEKHDIAVHTQLDDGVPTMAGSEVQLQQVVLNLVMNAKDAMQSAPSPRELRVKSERSANGRVQVSVEDSGPEFRSPTSNEFSSRWSRPRQTGWAWGLRSADRSSKHTTDEYGPRSATGEVRRPVLVADKRDQSLTIRLTRTLRSLLCHSA